METKVSQKYRQGFTLIEISIVLVIIGLIVGGVLVGRDLITAAGIRAQIAQIERYQVAVTTFKLRYDSLPGDIPSTQAARFNLTSDTEANGNGVIYHYFNISEPNLFWVQLGETRLIDGSFSLSSMSGTDASGSAIANYIPKAKMGGNFYVYVWSGGPDACHSGSTCVGEDGRNYFGLNSVSRFCDFNSCGGPGIFSVSDMRTSIAHAIDLKADDGLPQSGSVLALYFSTQNTGYWAGSDYWSSGFHGTAGAPATSPWPASANSCYDNNNTAGPMKYSLTYNNGANSTCALSFRFN